MRRFSKCPDMDVFQKWKKFVNMTARELRSFMDSEDGQDAGLSKEDAKEKGIKSGRESAEWILRMKPYSRSYRAALGNWTPLMWEWARRQNSFILRMSANAGRYYDDKGRPTRLLKSLLIWGHDPEK